MKLEDSPALRKGLSEVQNAKGERALISQHLFLHTNLAPKAAEEEREDGAGLGKMFSDPNLIGRLAANPRTQKHLADPAFVQKLTLMQRNPKLAEGALQDPRMIDVLGVLMGIDMQGFSRPEGSDELPSGVKPDDVRSSSPPQPAASSSAPKPSASTPPPAAKVEEEDIEMAEEDDEEAKAKLEAEVEKKAGADAYKQRDFTKAEAHFRKAWEVWPKDLTFLTNLAGKCSVVIGSHRCSHSS